MTRLSRRGVFAGALSAGIASTVAAVAEPGGGGYARAIAEAMARAKRTPEAVAERTVWTLIDVFAAILYATTLPETARAAAYFAKDGGGAVIPGTGLRAAPARAAAAIAWCIHAAEIDDSDMRGQLRASAVIMAATLAAAQAADCSGADFLCAAALGYTLQGRFAAPAGPIQGRGWMASGVWGPPAAAAAAASLNGASVAEAEAAIALAASSSGGIFQYYFDQSEEKRLIMARAARSAVESAELAALGERGAARAIEGKAGLYALFAGVEPPPASRFTDGLDALEGPLFIRPKFYAASHSIIPTLEGLANAAPDGIDAARVVRFVVRGDPQWEEVIGDKIDVFTPPQSRIGAALNFNFVIALWIVRGRVLPQDYTQETLTDPAILDLAARGSFEPAPGEQLSIEIALSDGAAIRAAALDPPMEEQAPLDLDRRLAKFEGLAGARLRAPDIAALKARLLGVGEARSMRAFLSGVEAMLG